jgi:hypothetical protein
LKYALILVCLPGFAAETPTKGEVQEIFNDVGKIAGFAPKKPVNVERITRKQLREQLEKRIRESVKPSDIRADELTLKWLGFAPADFDLRKTTIDLITEQAAAFYDYRKRKLVMLDNPIGEFDPGILAHELAHALADQHFKIGRYMDDGAKTDDGAMARMAVVEGQAQWIMTAYELLKRSKLALADHPDLLPAWKSTDPDNATRYPVLDKTPFYMRVTLLFPYWEGGRFQQAVVAKQGASAFRSVFADPPLSTQQILHPETYFEHRKPVDVPVPKEKKPGFRGMAEGILGELDHLVIFQMNKEKEAEKLAAGWRGGSYRVLDSKKQCCILLYASEWKDEDTAELARAAWSRHAAAKPVRGVSRVNRVGRVVTSVELPHD